MNIEYLRYAQAVARDGSFSAAARACMVSQPALSKGVAHLEGALGGKLFERSTTGTTLTPLGEQLLPLMTAAVGAVDGLTQAARQARAQTHKSIRLGVSPLIDSGLVAHAFAASRELLPDHTLTLREANMIPLQEALLSGELDLILVPEIGTIPGCEHDTVYREPMTVLLPAGDDAAPADRPIALEGLTGKPLVLVPDQCGLTAFTAALFTEHGIALTRYPGEAGSYQVLEEWTQMGLGTALIPESKLTSHAAARPLHHDGHPVLMSYQTVWLSKSRARPELTTLVRAIAAGARGTDTGPTA